MIAKSFVDKELRESGDRLGTGGKTKPNDGLEAVGRRLEGGCRRVALGFQRVQEGPERRARMGAKGGPVTNSAQARRAGDPAGDCQLPTAKWGER